MKGILKRSTSALLAVILCMSLSFSAFAAGNIVNEKSSFIIEVSGKVNSLLAAIEADKSMYGMGNVDFSALVLGEEIPAYEFKLTGLAIIEKLHYFPVLSSGEWIATATVSYNETGEMCVTISRDYIDIYKDVKESSAAKNIKGIAILFDDCNAYIYTGDDCVLAAESAVKVTNRVSANQYTENLNINTSEFAPVNALNINSESILETRSTPSVFSLWVPAKQQPTSNSCWAASLQSIMAYYGVNKTIAQIRTALFGSNTDSMASTAQSAYTIRQFGFKAGQSGADNGNFFYSFTLKNIQDETYTFGSPIFAGFKYSSGSVGHAVVIHGYSATTSNPTATFMDPASATYKATTIPSSGVLSYTNSSGSTLTLAAAFGVSN